MECDLDEVSGHMMSPLSNHPDDRNGAMPGALSDLPWKKHTNANTNTARRRAVI